MNHIQKSRQELTQTDYNLCFQNSGKKSSEWYGDYSDHLIKIASTLSNETYGKRLLKSYLMARSCKAINLWKDEERKRLFEIGETCRQCSISWAEGDFSIKIDRINISLKRAKKIMLLNNDKTNPKKQRFSKKLTKLANNTIFIKCLFCNHINKISLRKMNDEFKVEQKQRKQELQLFESTNLGKSANKRKKEKAAGLLMSIDKNSKKVFHLSQENHNHNHNYNQHIKSKNRKIQPKIVNIPKPNLLQLAKALKSNKLIQSNSNDKLKNLLG